MEPEIDPEPVEHDLIEPTSQQQELIAPREPETHYRGLKWIFVGQDGLRAGWSVFIVVLFMAISAPLLSQLLLRLHLISRGGGFNAREALIGELSELIMLIAAVGLVALIEKRHLLDYNLRGPRRFVHFLSGLAVGFAALSTLVGALAWGGWLRFGPVDLGGSQIIRYAAIWGCVFLLVGFFEEGSMRCYLQSTLTRGLNFWWALGIVASLCGYLVFRSRGNGAWGIYIIALLGLAPCLWLDLSKTAGSGFWQAAWVTSTIFGFGHTGNSGENWIGIFAAAFIGFVFCVSIWVTGSAWWAIGCHAAWDWAETYFYGTADSGLVAPGHLLSTSPAGNPLWSGGADGPEGSLLIIPVVLLILVWLLIVYRHPRREQVHILAGTEHLAGYRNS